MKVISTEFVENTFKGAGIFLNRCTDVHINAEFYNNTLEQAIFSYSHYGLNIENSTFTGNTFDHAIYSENSQNTQNIKGSTFTDNTVRNVVYSDDNKLYVIGSTFSANTLSGSGALDIRTRDVTVDDCLFAENKADEYRNIYSVNPNVKITNSVFDAKVDCNVSDIDYGQTEIINGTIDIGTNFGFTVNININNKVYPVNVTNNKFTYTLSNLTGGEYEVVLNPEDDNSNTFVFDKITKTFDVNRIDPGLKVTISNITQGEKLEVNAELINNATDKILYQLNGKWYDEAQLENLTLNHGNYFVTAAYSGNKNYYPVGIPIYVEVYKITPNITVSDAEANYGEDIEINVKVDVADYYTLFIDNGYDDSVSLYIDGNGTFTIPSENLKPGKYEIKVYKIETDDYNEAYGYANLTVNKANGFFDLTNVLIEYGENATVSVKVPVNAYGNITYKVYDRDMNLVYNITQSCLEELVVSNLGVGRYIVTGTFEGDSYYTNASRVNSGIIFVNNKAVNLDADDLVMGYKDGSAWTVTLTDADGNAIADAIVGVGINGKVYNVKTNSNGVAGITINLAPGTYDINATFDETSVYEGAFVNATITVGAADTVLSADNLIMAYKDGSAWAVTLTDANNNAISGVNIGIGIKGKVYTVKTDADGVAKLPVNLAPGTYDINATFGGNKYYSEAFVNATVTVEKAVATLTASDLEMSYKDGSAYSVNVVDANGAAVANAVVKFTIGTSNYNVKTDASGVAKLPINMYIGNYTVTATLNDANYESEAVSNTITVKDYEAELVASDVNMTYKDGTAYEVQLVDGEGNNITVANLVVKITIKGSTYNVKTDANGIAKLPINLCAGTYDISAEYNGKVVNNTIVVNKA